MTQKPFSHARFKEMPLIGILRKMPADSLYKLADIYQNSGLTTLEITMNSPGAVEMIYALAKKFPNLNIGAGTVCNLKDLSKAQDGGASFIVTPVLDETVIKACKQASLPVFPGAFSPTEIYRAWQAGADMVKVFPAGRLGAAYLKDVSGPLDQVKLLAVGGVGLENMTEFLKAGAQGLGLGSSLFPKELIEQEKWKSLEAHFQAFVEKYQSYTYQAT